jgi:hypothetical protein
MEPSASASTLASGSSESVAHERPWSPQVYLVDHAGNVDDPESETHTKQQSYMGVMEVQNRDTASARAAAAPQQQPVSGADFSGATLKRENLEQQTDVAPSPLPHDGAHITEQLGAAKGTVPSSGWGVPSHPLPLNEPVSDSPSPPPSTDMPETQVLFESPLAVLKKFTDGHWMDAGRGPVRVLRIISESPEQNGTFFRVDNGLRPVLYLNLEREPAQQAHWEKVRERSLRFLYPTSSQGPTIFVLQLRDAATADGLLALIERLTTGNTLARATNEMEADLKPSIKAGSPWTEPVAQPPAILRELQRDALFQRAPTSATFAATLEQLFEAATETLTVQGSVQERLLQELLAVRQTLTDTQGTYREEWRHINQRLAAIYPKLAEALSAEEHVSSDDPWIADSNGSTSCDNPLALAETRAIASSAEANPEHFLGFCARLCSFRPGLFPGSFLTDAQMNDGTPAPAVELACQGWVCRMQGTLYCGHCQATVDLGGLGATATRWIERCQHDPSCPWIQHWSPSAFASFRMEPGQGAERIAWASYLGEAADHLKNAMNQCVEALHVHVMPLELELLASHGWVFVQRRNRLLFACLFCGTSRLIAAGDLEKGLVPQERAGHHRPWCAFRDPTVAVEMRKRLTISTSSGTASSANSHASLTHATSSASSTA